MFGFLVFCLLSSCDMNSASSDDGSGELSTLDIVGADVLFVSSSVSSGCYRSTTTENNKLFKITADGSVIEVLYLDEDGDEIAIEYEPTYIQNINNDFVVAVFGYNNINPCVGYLVRKSYGSVFDLGENLPIQLYKDYQNADAVKTDGSGNLYFPYYSYEGSGSSIFLRKVNISDPDNITSELFSPGTDYINNFSVSDSGNAIYSGYLLSNSSILKNRVKKSNGGIYDVPFNYISHWTGLEGNLFYSAGYQDSYNIREVSIDMSYTLSTLTYSSPLELIPNYIENCYLLELSDRIAVYSARNSALYNVIFEVDNTSGSPRTVDLTGNTFISVTEVACSGSAYYIAGNVSGGGTIEKVDPDTGAMTALMTPGLYSVYELTVDSDDRITFNALRYSDGV